MFSTTPIYPTDILRNFFANKNFFSKINYPFFFFDFFFFDFFFFRIFFFRFFFFLNFFFSIFFFFDFCQSFPGRGLTPRNNPLTPKDVTPDPAGLGVRGHELQGSDPRVTGVRSSRSQGFDPDKKKTLWVNIQDLATYVDNGILNVNYDKRTHFFRKTSECSLQIIILMCQMCFSPRGPWNVLPRTFDLCKCFCPKILTPKFFFDP